MQGMYEFVRNIAVYIIFIGLTSAIIPEGKLRGYVDLTMNVILVIMLVSPVTQLLGVDFSGILADIGLKADKTAMAAEYVYNDESQNALILTAYKDNLKQQLNRLLTAYEGYSIVDAEFDVGSSEKDFGEIKGIILTVSEKSGTAEKGFLNGLVRIEPVTVQVGAGTPAPTPDAQEDEFMKKMKNAVSDFYNIPSSNIYIIVQKADKAAQKANGSAGDR